MLLLRYLLQQVSAKCFGCLSVKEKLRNEFFQFPLIYSNILDSLRAENRFLDAKINLLANFLMWDLVISPFTVGFLLLLFVGFY